MEASSAPKRVYRIVLADDHSFILVALKHLIAAEPDFELVGEAANGLDALALVRTLTPDVAVIDLAMPEMNGVALIRKIKEEYAAIKVLVLTGFEDAGHLQQALAAGASGYVVKRSAAGGLVPAIRAALTGGTFVDPSIKERLSSPRGSGSSRTRDLSSRESEVLRWTALGHSSKEIADKMGIGIKSVDTYRLRAMDKLDLKTRADVVQFALTEGWLR